MEEIDKLLKDINKKFGANALRKGSQIKEDMNFKIPLGSVSLTDALEGGLPSGRYITLAGQESSGKSLLAYKAIATVQNMRKKIVTDEEGNEYEVVAEDGVKPLKAALIQMESGSYSKSWGATHGIDNDKLIFCQPEGMEQALDIAYALQQEGVEFIVFDSIASMLPTKELDTDLTDTVQMGLRAKALNSYHGKFQSANNTLERNGKLPTTVLAINQLRQSIGTYGNPEVCLHGDTNVVLVDGRTLPIKDIVKNHIEGEVWAVDEQTGNFEPCKITGWHYNGKLPTNDDFYTIRANGVGSKNGAYSVTVTSDHLLLTDHGWKQAKDITQDDKLVTKEHSIVNGTLKDFLAGTFVGDCHLAINYNNANIHLQDKNNPEYVKWKVSKLSNAFNFHTNAKGNIYMSNYTTELGKIKQEIKDRDISYFLNNFSDLGLAVWYMDDGNKPCDRDRATISLKRFKGNFLLLSKVQKFFATLGMECSLYAREGTLRFSAKGSRELFKRICSFVPSCMQYKLPKEFQNKYKDFQLDFSPCLLQRFITITQVGVSSNRKYRDKGLYDLSIAKHHNFLAGGTGNGVVVHNCPGGNSQKFTNSLEIRTRGADFIKQNGNTVGRVIKWKLQKNKLGTAFKDGEYDLYIDDGLLPKGSIDTAKELVILAMQKGIIERRGAWFYYKGEQLAQGQEKAIEAVRSNEELFGEIVSKL